LLLLPSQSFLFKGYGNQSVVKTGTPVDLSSSYETHHRAGPCPQSPLVYMYPAENLTVSWCERRQGTADRFEALGKHCPVAKIVHRYYDE
jgi:hypothetical protein